MPAGGRALLALGLLALGCAAARPPPADNDFPERRRPPGPAPACPRDCGCTQEGVVDCGGIDLKEFPLLLPELTNHLSLQVRDRVRLPHVSPAAPRVSRAVGPCPSLRLGPAPSRCLRGLLGLTLEAGGEAGPALPLDSRTCLSAYVLFPTHPGRKKDRKFYSLFSSQLSGKKKLSKVIISVSGEGAVYSFPTRHQSLLFSDQ